LTRGGEALLFACVRTDPLTPHDADEAFFAGLDAQRARVLRRRFIIYCAGALAILVLALGLNLREVVLVPVGADAQQRGDSSEALMHAATCLALSFLYGPALFYLLRARPGRVRLVRLLSVVTIVAVGIAVTMEVLAAWANFPSWAPEHAAKTMEDTGYQAVNALGVLFCLACALIPMRLCESGAITLACAAVCAGVLAFMLRVPADLGVELALLLAGYTVVGTAYSAWRYRAFDFHFRAERLRERYNTLSGEAREISAELSQARRLHEALFPDSAALAAAGIEYRYEPMREIGGDFLFVHHDPEGPVTLTLIDVSGHGIAAALAVNRLHGELQRFFSHYPTAAGESGRPGHVLMNLNTYACAALAPQGVYATALVLRVDAGAAVWASAGHPTAYLRTGAGDLRDLPSTAVMLGVVDAELFDPAPQSVPFAPGDVLLAYTDGAAEARDSAGADFGVERIRAVLESRPAAPARALMDAVNRHRAGRPSDDTLIVEVRAVHSPADHSPKESAHAVR
jgi:serine phosphatase RsbU (regulator of sigma subunit)